MLSARTLLTAAIMVAASLAFVACGTGAPDTPTPPPAPTVAPVPTATAAPAAMDAPAADGDASASAPAQSSPAVPSVPHRDYNVLGDAAAPIVMYDYSDFA